MKFEDLTPDQLRVAVVGAGRMGRERASTSARCGASVVAVCDPDLDCGQKLADEHSRCQYMANWEELDWSTLDAVFVCTPPFARGPVELAAIEAGVPFFVEKPIGLSAQHAQPIRDALRRRPVLNAVGYMNRYRESVQRARTALTGQAVLGATSRWLCGNYRVSWWGQKQLSGGPLNEQATHLVDLTRFLLGEVTEVQALVEPRDWQTSQIQTAVINLRLASGALHSIFYSCQAATKWIGFEAFTADCHVQLDGWDLQWRDANGTVPNPTTDRSAIFRDEVQAFFNAIRSGSPTILCDFEDAFRTQQTVDAIHEALARADASQSDEFKVS